MTEQQMAYMLCVACWLCGVLAVWVLTEWVLMIMTACLAQSPITATTPAVSSRPTGVPESAVACLYVASTADHTHDFHALCITCEPAGVTMVVTF
jgi:hypothetical protein